MARSSRRAAPIGRPVEITTRCVATSRPTAATQPSAFTDRLGRKTRPRRDFTHELRFTSTGRAGSGIRSDGHRRLRGRVASAFVGEPLAPDRRGMCCAYPAVLSVPGALRPRRRPTLRRAKHCRDRAGQNRWKLSRRTAADGKPCKAARMAADPTPTGPPDDRGWRCSSAYLPGAVTSRDRLAAHPLRSNRGPVPDPVRRLAALLDAWPRCGRAPASVEYRTGIACWC